MVFLFDAPCSCTCRASTYFEVILVQSLCILVCTTNKVQQVPQELYVYVVICFIDTIKINHRLKTLAESTSSRGK